VFEQILALFWNKFELPFGIPFGTDFGSVWDPFLGPISLQRATQRFFEIGPKIVPKNRFGIAFEVLMSARATLPSMNVDLFSNN
jgi:hypothetical protein